MMNIKNKLLLLTLCVMNFSGSIVATVLTGTPMMSRVYGNRYTPEILQNPEEGLLGTLNLGFGSAGSLNMFDQLADSKAPAVRILSNGSIFVLLSSSTATGLAMYSGAGVYQESFTLSGLLEPYFMQLDSQANLLLGGDGGWLQRFNTTAQFFDGDFAASFSLTAGTWDFIGNIAEQSNGNLIITGLKDSYTQVARLLPSGALDTTFGVDGFIIFDGHAGSGDSVFPTSITGAYNVVVTQDDSIVVAYCDNETSHAFAVKFLMNGQLATGFGNQGIRTNVVGAAVVIPNQIYTALNDTNGIIIGATLAGSRTSIGLLAFNVDSGNYADGIIPMTIPSSGSDSLEISSLMTLSNGAIVVTSSNFSTNPMRMRVDQFLADGTIDTDFNADDTPGFLEFSIIPPAGQVTTGYCQSAAIAPNGQLFVAGYQTTLDPSSTIPYLSQIYEYSYISEISQSPSPILQGVIDDNFGVPFGLSKNKQTYPGIVSPYVGDYRGNLQQHPKAIMQINHGTVPAVGDLLVGMYGSTNNSSAVTMMLNWLTPSGVLDENLGDNFSGQLILLNLTTTQEFPSNEFLYDLAQDVQGSVYVAGGVAGEIYRGATLRKYTYDVTGGWTNGHDVWNIIDSNEDIQNVGIAMQGQDRILLFEACGSYGTIAAFDAVTGHLADGTEGASSFGQDGCGYINYVDQINTFIDLGPVYCGIINNLGEIFVAYRNNSTGKVDLAGFLVDGSGLLTSFGVNGVVSNIFGLTGSAGEDFGIDRSSVRIVFDAFGNLIVCSVEQTNSNILVAKINQVTAELDTYFGINGIATINFNNGMLTQLQAISDGSIVITGALNYNQMAVIRLTSQGELDTTFDAQGSQPGISIISAGVNPYQASANGVVLQSNESYSGDLVVIGEQYLYSADSTPMVMRLFGQPDTTAVRTYPEYLQELGTLDESFNATGGFNLSNLTESLGNAKFVYAYPADSQYAGLLLIGISNSLTTTIVRFNPGSLLLDPTFNAESDTPGLYVTTDVWGLSVMTVDANERIIIAGSYAGISGAQRLTADGAFDVSFEFPRSYNFGKITCIAQQKSGRYIFAADIGGIGCGLAAYQDELIGSNTTLQLDSTFNPMSEHTGLLGVCGDTIYSIAINSDDTILAAFTNGYLYIAKIYANGSGPVDGFNINQNLLTPSIPATGKIALDANENIIASAVIDEETIQVVRYTEDGHTDIIWNNNGTPVSIAGMGHSVYLTSLIESTTGQTLLLGYNTVRRINGIHGPLFAVSLDSIGALDTTWNANAIPADVPGILTYQVDGSTSIGSGAFGIEGNLYTVGANLENEPLIMKIVANGSMATQQPLATNSGIIDSTINTQGNGYDSLNLNNQLSFAPGVPQSLHLMNNSNGAMIMGSVNATTGYITKLNADLTLDTDFNASGTQGYVEVVDIQSITDLFVNDGNGNDGNIYVTGAVNDSSIWAQLIGSAGNFQIPLTAPNLLTESSAICLGNNNILIAGKSYLDGVHGTIAAFNSDFTQLDFSFGNGIPGYYVTNSSNPIAAMTVDNQYRIYIASLDGTNLTVQRILANGSGLDTDFEPRQLEVNGSWQVKLALDQVHNNLVVAYQNGTNTNNVITTQRLSTIDGSDAGSASISFSGTILELSDLIVDTDQNIYIVGYVAESPYTTIVARFNSITSTTIALDPSYAADSQTPGIAQEAITPFDDAGYTIGAAVLHPDRRVYVVGGSSAGSSTYMARFFGDNYATEIDQAIPALNRGDYDPTYGNGRGYAVTFVGGGSYDTGRNQQVKSIKHLQSTNLMTVIDDGINSWTLRVLQDGSNDPSYGPTPGGQGAPIAKLSGNESVSNMIVSGAGEYFVIGNNSGSGKGYLKKISTNGLMDSTFGGYTGISTTKNYPAGTVYGLMSNPVSLVELSNGNVVVVGNNAGVGMIQLVGSTGLVSSIFGGSGSIINGNNIPTISADGSDNLYIAVGYLSGDMNAVRVMKFNAAGQLDTTFGENGIVDVIGGVADFANIQLALDAQNNIIIAVTSQATPGVFTVLRLLPNGTFDPNFNNDNILNIELPNSATAVANLANIVPLQDGKILIAGYQQDDTSPENNIDFVACIDPYGILDTTFNQYQEQGSINGIAMFLPGGGPELRCPLYNIDVQANGQIVAATAQFPHENQAAPFTIRLIGYENRQGIAQYPGDIPVVPSVLNPAFNGTGISGTPRDAELSLISGGPVVLDSRGNTIIAGITSDLEFVVARFLSDGTFDTNFGIDGIGTSSLVNNLIAATCSIAIDQYDNLYVGGITITNQFVVVKFDASGNFVNDYGSLGISLTDPSDGIILINGGYLAKNIGDEIIIGGYSSTGQFAINQLDIHGNLITSYQSEPIAMLMSGGYVVFDSQYNLFVSGTTSVGNLVVVKFTQIDDVFIQDTLNFGISGVASAQITNGLNGGSIATDSHDYIVIGGYTLDETVVVARFTPDGELDLSFNGTGIAYSNPIVALQGVSSIAIGTLDDIILGGYARDYSGLYSMIVAVFTKDGAINTQFSATGIGSTGSLELRTVPYSLTSGGFVAITPAGQINLGGVQFPSIMTPASSRLVVAQMYSGYEIFITDPSTLTPVNLKTYYYGNNLNYFNSVLSIDLFAAVIPDNSTRQIVIDAVKANIAEFIAIYENVPGFNVTWHVYLNIASLQALEVSLIEGYASSSQSIGIFFNTLINRINGLKIS